MTKHPAQADYLYASARIRAVQARKDWHKELDRLLALPDADSVEKALCEETADAKDATVYLMQEAFATVTESVPDPALLLFLRYLYDGHNLKVLEKCRRKGTDPTPLLIDLGSVSARTLQTVSENELQALLPPHLAAAVPQAREAFDKTGNPREIDFILDRAVFCDMAAAAAPVPLSAAWVTAKAELTDLLICYRLIRMGGTLGRNLLTRAAIGVGRFDEQTLLAMYDGGEDAFLERVFLTPYGGIFEKNISFSEAERRAQAYLCALVKRKSAVTFGPEIPIAYLLDLQALTADLRILLAGKAAGLDPATVRSRMRSSYV